MITTARSSRRRAGALVRAALLLVAIAAGTACAAEVPPGAVVIAPLDGTVNGVLERYVERVIERAESANAAAVVFEVDTPGGSIDAMKGIVGRIERSAVPVIAWVGPSGAQAASAGTFIVMAAHVAVMAPGTTIGAATPISATGEDLDGALGRKVTNDTVAFARAVAEIRGRNADWAEDAVRRAVSATPSEAAERGVVDAVAASLEDVLATADGRTVALLDGSEVTIAVEGAARRHLAPNLYERALRVLSNPALVAILFLIALAGIAAEFFAPGLFLPGTIGGVALLLAMLGTGTLLPVEAAIALILLGSALAGLELFVPSGGVLGAVAALAIALGLFILLGRASTALDAGGVVRVLGVFLAGLVALLVAAAIALVRGGYLAERSETGGRLL